MERARNLVLNGHEQLSKTIYLSEYARYKIDQIAGLHTIEPIGVYHQSYDVTKLGKCSRIRINGI